MINIIRSEFYKLKHTWIFAIYLFVPVIYACIFFLAVQFTGLQKYATVEVIQTYFVILCGTFPIVISMIVSKVVDMELIAGKYQVLLTSTKIKIQAYIGKLCMLQLGMLFSLLVAIGLFWILYGHQNLIDWVIEFILISVGCIIVTSIHLWITLSTSGNVSLGLAIIESLLVFLTMTGLGDYIWYFIPATWSARLSCTYLMSMEINQFIIFFKELLLWSCIAFPISVIFLVASLSWFCRWEGQSFME